MKLIYRSKTSTQIIHNNMIIKLEWWATLQWKEDYGTTESKWEAPCAVVIKEFTYIIHCDGSVFRLPI